MFVEEIGQTGETFRPEKFAELTTPSLLYKVASRLFFDASHPSFSRRGTLLVFKLTRHPGFIYQRRVFEAASRRSRLGYRFNTDIMPVPDEEVHWSDFRHAWAASS